MLKSVGLNVRPCVAAEVIALQVLQCYIFRAENGQGEREEKQ